jgi:hypothetical protein
MVDEVAGWKWQMTQALIAKDIWDHVEGTAVDPGPGGSAAERATYSKGLKRAKALLATAISQNLVYLVSACESPKDIWDALKGHFERDTFANKLLLKKKLFSMKMRENQAAEEHLRSMKEITDQLAALNAGVAEEEQVVALLLSLPPRYSNLVTALETKGEDLSLKFVGQALINEEQKRFNNKNSSSGIGNKDSALQASKHERVPFKGRCYKCDRYGHKSSECRQGKKWSKKKPHKANVASRSQGEDSGSEEPGSDLFIADSGFMSSENPDLWYLDSGASRHMTPDQSLLRDYREFKVPEPVRIGDGRVLNGMGIGTVKIKMNLGFGGEKVVNMADVLFVPNLVCNLFSARAAAIKGNMIIQFGHTRCWIKDSKTQSCR